MMKGLLIYLLLAILVGCIDVEPLEPTARYGVFCVLVPEDSVVMASVVRVIRIGERFTTDSLTVAGADVTLTNETGGALRLVYNAQQRRYIAANRFFVKPNQTYWIAVTLSDSRPLTASCTVPDVAPALRLNGQTINEEFAFSAQWQDNPNQSNQYKLSHTISSEANPTTTGPVNGTATIVSTSVFLFVNWDDTSNPSVYINDELTNNQRLLKRDGVIRRLDAVKKLTLSVSLLNADKLYIDYDRLSLKQSGTEDDLLTRFSEPIELPSNVENGLGAFCAYSRSTVSIQVK